MARAELAAPGGMIRVESCGHFMCTCKTELNESPMQALVVIQKPRLESSKMYTPLRILDGDREKTVEVRGVRRREEVAEAFNGCEGPEITASGIVCGAIYRLERK